jgi:hypothetical protein
MHKRFDRSRIMRVQRFGQSLAPLKQLHGLLRFGKLRLRQF